MKKWFIIGGLLVAASATAYAFAKGCKCDEDCSCDCCEERVVKSVVDTEEKHILH